MFGKDEGYTFDQCMTADEWWSEFDANVCCVGRAASDCGCGGYTALVPGGISRLLKEERE